jgi:hypothetical protein
MSRVVALTVFGVATAVGVVLAAVLILVFAVVVSAKVRVGVEVAAGEQPDNEKLEMIENNTRAVRNRYKRAQCCLGMIYSNTPRVILVDDMCLIHRLTPDLQSEIVEELLSHP